MRYEEILQSGILDEMTRPKSEAIIDLDYGQKNLTNHVLKVLCFEPQTNKNHWLGEIRGSVKAICGWKMRHNKKPIDPDLVVERLYTRPFDNDPEKLIAARINDMMSKNGYTLKQGLDLQTVSIQLNAAITIFASMVGSYDEEKFMTWVPR